MIIVGLFTSQKEITEVQYIANIYRLKKRIHLLVEVQRKIEKELIETFEK